MTFETVEVPFKMSGNRRCLTDEQLSEEPHLADFVRRFKDSFERDERMAIWLFPEPRP
jgi:hypothetical protein